MFYVYKLKKLDLSWKARYCAEDYVKGKEHINQSIDACLPTEFHFSVSNRKLIHDVPVIPTTTQSTLPRDPSIVRSDGRVDLYAILQAGDDLSVLQLQSKCSNM